MTRCPTCQSDDRADRRVIETLPPTDAFVDPYLCDDEWHSERMCLCGHADASHDDLGRCATYPLCLCEFFEEFHEPPDLYDPGEARPDPTRYAEWRKGGAGWGER